ncbi:MAG: hypothetical protein UZ21_OP11001000015 [Microgenomates bacterium OLB22]|nr:MAG: hypothetical protein UZ21_OP11001000015 [Microgenomates bacterium OLB22]
MIIGIDISQIAYPGTGVARYVKALLMNMLPDKSYKYHCFFSSLRGTIPPDIISLIKKTDTKITKLPIPPTLLSWLWNDKHIISIDHFLPDADIIITSDWTEPPSEKIKITIVHDMVIYKHPETTTQKTAWSNDAFAPLPNIAATQKKRLHWVQKESRLILADSYSTKKDVVDILSTDGQRVEVVYPSVMIKKPSRADLQRVQKKV